MQPHEERGVYELKNDHRRFDSLFSDPALGVEALESVLDEIERSGGVRLVPRGGEEFVLPTGREPHLAEAPDPALTPLRPDKDNDSGDNVDRPEGDQCHGGPFKTRGESQSSEVEEDQRNPVSSGQD